MMWVGAKDLGKSVLPENLVRLLQHRHFLWAQRTKGFDVPSQPVFDAPATEFFLDHIRSSRVYLEYGSGGSTLVAGQHVDTLISVESDKYYLRSVEKRLRRIVNESQTRVLIHANIGITEEWGIPMFQEPTARRLRRWAGYTEAPWRWLDRHDVQPDTILVDGRFRAACVLESAGHIRAPESCLILVDDYAGRPEYRVVERFCDLERMAGRMAVLRRKAEIDRNALAAALAECQRDFR